MKHLLLYREIRDGEGHFTKIWYDRYTYDPFDLLELAGASADQRTQFIIELGEIHASETGRRVSCMEYSDGYNWILEVERDPITEEELAVLGCEIRDFVNE